MSPPRLSWIYNAMYLTETLFFLLNIMFMLSFFSRVGSLSPQGKINEEGSSWLGSPLSWALLTRRMTTLIVLALSAVYSDKPGSVISSVLLLKKRSQMLFVHEKNKKSFKMNQWRTKQPLATDVPHVLPSFLPVQMNDCRKQCSNYTLQERLGFSSMDKHDKK